VPLPTAAPTHAPTDRPTKPIPLRHDDDDDDDDDDWVDGTRRKPKMNGRTKNGNRTRSEKSKSKRTKNKKKNKEMRNEGGRLAAVFSANPPNRTDLHKFIGETISGTPVFDRTESFDQSLVPLIHSLLVKKLEKEEKTVPSSCPVAGPNSKLCRFDERRSGRAVKDVLQAAVFIPRMQL
jgi:hypothetical protein